MLTTYKQTGKQTNKNAFPFKAILIKVSGLNSVKFEMFIPESSSKPENYTSL